MSRKVKRILTDGPQLDYVSPWKVIDTYRTDNYYLISKNKIMEQIIMPAHLQMQRRNQIAEVQSNLPSPKRTHRTLNSIQSETKHKNFKKNEIYSGHAEISQNKEERRKEFFDNIIFIRRSKPSKNLRIVSLGIQEDDYRQQIFRKRFSLMHKRVQIPNQYERINRSIYMQKQNPKEQFKRLNLTLMGKLKYGSQQKERQVTKRLHKTLKHFMKQQTQI